MQDSPDRIWIAGGHYWPDPTFNNNKRSYTRTDLCVTEAECQRRIVAERAACAAIAKAHDFGSTAADVRAAQIAAAIMARNPE